MSGANRARVVYFDNEIAVVDKPAGLVVHPGAGNPTGTLVQQLLGMFPEMAAAGPDNERPGIVQRLDKGTSGLLVVALTARAREALVAQLASRSVLRRYLAVVHGCVEADEGVIDAPLARSPDRREKMAVVEGGRDARTRYAVLARSSALLPSTLLSCRLETGRTHQVRAHLAAIGHPVVGDDRYAGARLRELARQALPALCRPWLHAAELGFAHPVTGEQLRFSSEAPAELTLALERLGLSVREPRRTS
jgi:23S rRNA pseudouridine1911/1915/1917 synthase